MARGTDHACSGPVDTAVVLGLSSGFHDASATLLVDGEIVAAVEQERLSRQKHDATFPSDAASCCLAIAGATAADIDLVSYHQKPLGILDRHLATRLRTGPSSLGALLTETPKELRRQLGVGHQIGRWFRSQRTAAPPIHIAEHHTSHAAAAFYPSPFDEAAVLTIDGVGEWATTTIAHGRGNRLRTEAELRFPDSVGLLYSAFTAYCGFRVNTGEGELMGLAPFGEPVHAQVIRDQIVDVRADGSIHLAPEHFAYTRGRRTTTKAFHDLFGGEPRPPGSTPGLREADLAASIQEVLVDIVLALAHRAKDLTGADDLCLGGGVALNCVANGRLEREGPFDRVWVQPAAGDAGNSMGAALWSWHSVLDRPRPVPEDDAMRGAFLGPSFSRDEIERWLDDEGIEHQRIADDAERCRVVAERIASGAAVGWFCGRMEFGPRALGHRSIVADPRSPTIQGRINQLVKERASFRPFAPAVLADRCDQWFDHHAAAPYMTFAAPVREDRRTEAPTRTQTDDLASIVAIPRSQIPAVTHVDGSARVQTVDERRNPEFAALLRAFDQATGCPVLLNTSFNARDEPIVCTPADAYATFVRTGLDLLVLEHCLVERR